MEDRYLGQIMQGMQVVDLNGDAIGVVAHAHRYDPIVVGMAGGSERLPYDELLEVKTGFLGLGKRLFIPLSAVEEVTPSSVLLSKSAEQIEEAGEWHEKPAYLKDLH